jgi:hypothetical protein
VNGVVLGFVEGLDGLKKRESGGVNDRKGTTYVATKRRTGFIGLLL